MAFKRTGTILPMRTLALAAFTLGISSLAVLAQTNGGSQDVTHGLTDPKNGGVAGTGMGTPDKTSGSQSGGVGSGGAAGTGMSVKGPAGQGITGSGTSGLDGTAPGTKPVGQ